MSGPLRLVPDEGTPGWAEETMRLRTLPPRRRRPQAPDPADPKHPPVSADPLDDLAERLADLCADAVHPYEIAAFLESDGLTDEQAALLYGRADAFTLAEELFAKVDRRYPGPSSAENPWRIDPWRCVLRGLVFALPGLAYLLGADLFAPHRLRYGLPSGMAATAAATLISWAWNQALAHRAYGWQSRLDRRSAGLTLAIGAPLGAVLAGGCGWLIGGPLAALVFLLGQSGYLAAATVLLVLGREKHLLVALAPSAVGALLVHLVDLNGLARAAVLVSTLAAALGLAGWELTDCLRAPATVHTGPSWSSTLAAGLFGLGVGTLTMVAGLGAAVHHGLRPHAPAVPDSAAAGPALVALTLSLGLAEWLLYRYRAAATTALRVSLSPGDFRRRTTLALAGCLGGYVAAVAALDYAVTPLWASAHLISPTRLAALLLLAAALWTALLLQALSVAWRTAGLAVFAAGSEILALLLGGDPVMAQVYGCGAAAAVLVPVAVVVLGRTTRHR
ncbi:hypothetical protein C7C46_12515 [Streptomyces tateyamensis]|uniref:Integral membrane protein n=1 Tax=Streptomyces tateyamensis TaxID=565073 RepID=A0A2V4NLJ5_9ACTN|nr:hypothetical protein [Streptomyces tateyamensis]PYC80513.1 hypothetical protein C7C46_12515 [Streptomyces tateyamensis]